MSLERASLERFRARLVSRAGQRAALDVVDPRALAAWLAPWLPPDLAEATDFRTEGMLSPRGEGWLVTEVPFGGSVIEGYHVRFEAVLVNGVVVSEAIDGEYGGALEALAVAGPPDAVEEVARHLRHQRAAPSAR